MTDTGPAKKPAKFSGFQLLSAVGQTRAVRRSEDESRYAEIIRQPAPEHVGELHELAARLGKSNEEMHFDFKAVERAGQLEDLIREGKGSRTRVANLQSELAAHIKETEQIAADRERRRIELDNAELHASAAYRQASRHEDELAALKIKFPAAVGRRDRVVLED
jgi:hypothetical protein